MAELDRSGLIELLDRLGAEDDTTVLETARALYRKAAESGYTWDDIIRPERDFQDEPVDETPVPAEADPDTAEVARLVDRLLRKGGLSDTSREDLAEMKQQIAAGSLDPDDARYVRALARRLGV